jgi:hypothetical protein
MPSGLPAPYLNIFMKLPSANDWSYSNIRAGAPDRANALDDATTQNLIDQIEAAFIHALSTRSARFAIDSIGNEFQSCRAIIQFHVPSPAIDAFFNARVGYRAHFWASPEVGLNFNHSLIARFRRRLVSMLSTSIEARKIEVRFTDEERHEVDLGPIIVESDQILRSLDPDESKIWLCERLVQPEGKDPIETGIMLGSIRSPKLDVGKWENARHHKTGQLGEGLRAPIPVEEKQEWLDLKGGFATSDQVIQMKDKLTRAHMINELGWT